jgi:hypothetical protein
LCIKRRVKKAIHHSFDEICSLLSILLCKPALIRNFSHSKERFRRCFAHGATRFTLKVGLSRQTDQSKHFRISHYIVMSCCEIKISESKYVYSVFAFLNFFVTIVKSELPLTVIPPADKRRLTFSNRFFMGKTGEIRVFHFTGGTKANGFSRNFPKNCSVLHKLAELL